MIPLALHQASTDTALNHAALRVYVFLHGHLDYYTFRPVKLVWLSRHLTLHQSYLTKILQLLTRRGYLERGPREHPSRRGPPLGERPNEALAMVLRLLQAHGAFRCGLCRL